VYSASSCQHAVARGGHALDGETLYGPHRHCRGYGKPFSQGYVVQTGTSRGPPRAWWTACDARGVWRDGTASDGLEAEAAMGETAGRALAAGQALRATARSVPVAQDTGGTWRPRVACPWRTVLRSCWHAVPVSACPRDALWRGVPPQEAPRPGAPLSGDPAGDAGGWSALAPVWRVVLAGVSGTRAQAGAEGRLARVAPGPDDALPWGTSAPWPAYRPAWLPPYGAG
jgi:hypothetical protein